MSKNIGILALQGDFNKHSNAVEKLGCNSLLVRNEKDLHKCDYLIIPGGESTTFLNLIDRINLRTALLNFAKNRPIMGTCAGLIILATKVDFKKYISLGLIDISIKRNAYGRQIDSFVDKIHVKFDNKQFDFEGVFIRAPKIESCGNDVSVLGYHNDDMVLVSNKTILVATFHPELTDDLRIHEYFIKKF